MNYGFKLEFPKLSSRRTGCRRIGKKPGIVILNGAKRSEGSCLKLVVTIV